MANEKPALPLVDLRSAAQAHPEAGAALDDFEAEFASDPPDHAKLAAHAERLRGFAAVAGPFERWWLSPRVQEFLAELGATGI